MGLFFRNVDVSSGSTLVTVSLFILVANVIGTNIIIPNDFTFEFAWRIWTWSIVADIVFIITMAASFLIPLELHSNSKFYGKTPVYGILSGIMVYVGYMISWHFVCTLSDPFELGVKTGASIDLYYLVFYGYWGALACMLYSMVVMAASSERSYEINYECPYCHCDIPVAPRFSGVTSCSNCKKQVGI
jgi:hypothetical protein